MANPRKFSEKIALHTQKQAEETAAFEQIMREARAVTTAPQQRDQSATARQQPPQLLNAITNASFRGGSLPNVNAMAQRGDRTQPVRQMGQLSTSPRASGSQSKIGHPRYSQKARAENAPYASPPSLSHLNQVVSGQNSPTCTVGSYGANNFLSLPVVDGWRRANSDSAINSINSNSLLIPSTIPDSSHSSEESNNSNDPRDTYVLTTPFQLHKPQDISTVGDGSNLEIPASVSRSSLPDLTNFQFQTPIQQQDDPQNSTSPYSTSPLSMTYSHSPTSCSPNSQQQQQPTVTGNLPPHPGQVVNQQQQNRQPQQQVQHQQPPRSPIPQQQQQQFPPSPSPIPSQSSQYPTQTSLPPQSQPNNSPQQQTQPNQLMDNTSFHTHQVNENMLTAYRCPPRPSPQNSPSPFRSPSPHDGQLSAPPSPSNQPLSADSLFLSQQANALQQHFEQISMVDGTPQTNSNNNRHWQQGGGIANSVYFYNGQQPVAQTAGVSTQQASPHHQPPTPQTPSSIPDIIFTEFLGTDCTDPLEDFLTSEAAAAAFREGLGPIDTGDLNMLADPNLILPDPNAEDSFRLDRL